MAGLSGSASGNIPLGPKSSLWPKARLGITNASPGPVSTTINFEVPLLVHIVPHFFLAVGPYVTIYRPVSDAPYGSNSAQSTRGLDTFVGGWW